MNGDAVSLRLKSFEIRSKLCVCRWDVFIGAMIVQMCSHSTTPRFSMGNVSVESRAAKSAAGLFLWRGAQKFAAEISTARRSMPVADLKLRLNGPGRSLSRL